MPLKTKSQLSTPARVQGYRRIVSPSCSGPLSPLSMSLTVAVNKRLRDAENRVQPQPYRKSLRLQEIRQLNQQRLEHTEKPTRSSLRTIKTHHGVGEEEAQASCRIPRAPRNCQLTHAVVVIHTTDQRSKTISLQKQRRGTTRAIPDEPQGAKESWVPFSLASCCWHY